MTKRRKPLNTQDLRTYAKENQIDVASDSALKNCGVLFPQSKQGEEVAATAQEPVVQEEQPASAPAKPAQKRAPGQKKSLRSIVESMVEAAAVELDAEAAAEKPRSRGAGSQKSLGTRELWKYAEQNQIEVASGSALKNCGVLRPEQREVADENAERTVDMDCNAGWQSIDLCSKTVELDCKPGAQSIDIASQSMFAAQSVDENFEGISDAKALYAPTVEINIQPWSPAPPPQGIFGTPPVPYPVPGSAGGSPAPAPAEPVPAGIEKPSRRKTRVQEFDITDLVARATPSPEVEAQPDLAIDYFTGAAESRTYTAELRFRAQFTEQTPAPPVVSEQQPAPEQWSAAESFAPPSDEHARIHQYSDFNNMLDLVDERYQPIPSVNFQQGAVRQQPEVEVEFTQNSSRLSNSSGGLASGLGVTKSTGRQKNRWSKK